ncbi:MAG: DUF2510 domain-containing protein [Solirubrobacteraceae bacterium]
MTGESPPAPPGWYQDPDEPGVLRYWDGSEWSSSPPTVPPPTVQVNTPVMKDRPPSELSRRLGDQPGVFWGAVAASVAMGVGAVGTWATALGFISIAGTSGEGGQVVLGAAVVGLLALWVRTQHDAVWPALVALLFGAVGGGISGVDLHKLSGIGTSDFFGQQVHLVHAGWGIYLAVGAGAALILLSLAVIVIGHEDTRFEAQFGTSTGEVPASESTYSAGIGFVVLAISVGAVLAVSHIGLRNSSSLNTSSAAAVTQSSEAATTPSTSTEASSTPATETATTPTPGSESLEALERYWADIGAHNYSGAYTYLAPGASGLSESEFISSEQHAGIQHVEFHGQTGASSSSTATIEVASLITHDQQFGCRIWSGSYETTNQNDAWLIKKASLTPRPCG